MAEKPQMAAITVGGKGSSLSSAFIFLVGNKLDQVEVDAVSSIPEIYGSLREAARAVHSRAGIQLNSAAKGGMGGTGK